MLIKVKNIGEDIKSLWQSFHFNIILLIILQTPINQKKYPDLINDYQKFWGRIKGQKSLKIIRPIMLQLLLCTSRAVQTRPAASLRVYRIFD
jgi:hypothetical protein